MKILSVTTLAIATLLFSNTLLAKPPGRFAPNFNNDFLSDFAYDFSSGFGNDNSDDADDSLDNSFDDSPENPSDCEFENTDNHSHPAELELSTTPFTYDSPILAVNAFAPVQLIASKYLKKDFELVDHYAQIYNYVIAPTGDYHWGDYVIELESPNLSNSLTTTYVTITVFINYIEEDDAYSANGFNVQQEIVN